MSSKDLIPTSSASKQISKINSNTELVKLAIQHEKSNFEKWPRHTMTTPLVGTSKGGNFQLTIPKTPNQDSSGNERTLVKREKTKNEGSGQPAIVLEEQEYISNIEKIITRDYFPESDTHGIAATVAPKESLDSFQQKYTSEDNDSFNNIMISQAQKEKEKVPWFWRKNQTGNSEINDNTPKKLMPGSQQRLLTYEPSLQDQVDIENKAISKALGWSDHRKTTVGTWKNAQPTNPLLFHPEKHRTGLTAKQHKDQKEKIINHTNTRFPPPKAPENDSNNKTDAIKNIDTRTVPGLSENPKPLVNGYSFVTPSTYEKEKKLTVPEPPQSGDKKEFTMSAQPEKEALRDRLIAKKSFLRRQEHGISSISSSSSSPMTSGSSRIRLTPSSRVGKLTSSKQISTPLSPAASSLLSSISNKRHKSDFSVLPQHTPLRKTVQTLKGINSPVVVKKKR